MEFGSIAFSVVSLDIDQWIWSIFFGVGSLLWGQVFLKNFTGKYYCNFLNNIFKLVISFPEEKFIALFSCCMRKKVEENQNHSPELNGKAINGNGSLTSNGNGNDIVSPSKYDLEIEDNTTSKILWLRGIGRISNQVRHWRLLGKV